MVSVVEPRFGLWTLGIRESSTHRRHAPRVDRYRLADHLVGLRLECRLSLEEAARRLRWPPRELDEAESGAAEIHHEKLLELLAAYHQPRWPHDSWQRFPLTGRPRADESLMDERGVQRDMAPGHLRQTLNDALGNMAYGRPPDPGPIESFPADPVWFSKNESFWDLAGDLNMVPGLPVVLDRFSVQEWVPVSPGHYHTPEAEWARQSAERYRYDSRKYLPAGKGLMIDGGVGSLRLAPRRVHGEDRFYLCASSSGVSYQGIPVLFPRHLYIKVRYLLATVGYVWGQIRGELQVLPSPETRMIYSRTVPRLCVYATEFEPEQIQPDEPALASAQLVFGPRGGPQYGKSWCYAHFRPGSDDIGLHRAVDWMYRYVQERVGSLHNAAILTDFDEIYDHFTNVEFPLRDIMSQRIDSQMLHDYRNMIEINVERFNVTHEHYHVGSVGPNSTVVIRSTVENSFNRLAGAVDPETERALRSLGMHLAETGNSEAVDLYDMFTAELAQQHSRPHRLRLLWEGIKQAAPTAATLTGVVETITRIVGS